MHSIMIAYLIIVLPIFKFVTNLCCNAMFLLINFLSLMQQCVRWFQDACDEESKRLRYACLPSTDLWMNGRLSYYEILQKNNLRIES